MTTASIDTKVTRTSVEIKGTVARVALRNPPLNVIDIPMMEELLHVLQDMEANPEASVLVISGEGKAFSAGVDVAAHAADKVEAMLQKFHAVIRALVASKKVTIASVHGHCLGGGAELAMVCDFIFTTDNAQWAFPEIKLGCYPPIACTALAALVGPKRAADLILTGRTIDGREAAAIGLATRAVCPSDLATAVDETLGHLAKLSGASLSIAKKAIYAWDAMHFDKGLARAERIYLEELINSNDAQEGIQAFLEKREPKWSGR